MVKIEHGVRKNISGEEQRKKEMDRQHPLDTLLAKWRLVLGSKSPRRVELLTELGLDFEVRPSHFDEQHGAEVAPRELPLLLAQGKARDLRGSLATDELLITADTIVILDDEVIEKPRNLEEAADFLRRLSGHWHQVVTAFVLTTAGHQASESVESEILFAPLTEEEIAYYLSRYEVLDKAGAYGVQDWIGLIGVREIRGSYHNVMGLPTSVLYHQLKEFLIQL